MDSLIENKANLRAILCKIQAKWEVKNFDPPPLKVCMQLDIVGGGVSNI